MVQSTFTPDEVAAIASKTLQRPVSPKDVRDALRAFVVEGVTTHPKNKRWLVTKALADRAINALRDGGAGAVVSDVASKAPATKRPARGAAKRAAVVESIEATA